MPTTDAQRRFLKLLTQTCDQARQVAETGDDMDLVLGDAAVIETDIPCLIQAVSASADMRAAGPIERDLRQLFTAPDLDVQRRDLFKDEDGTIWVVNDVPQVFNARGVPHHLEVTVERKAVQDGWPS